MSEKATYCKCKNTYTKEKCEDNNKCKTPHYWKQGIGKIQN